MSLVLPFCVYKNGVAQLVLVSFSDQYVKELLKHVERIMLLRKKYDKARKQHLRVREVEYNKMLYSAFVPK